MNVQSKNVIPTVYFQIADFPFRGKNLVPAGVRYFKIGTVFKP
jgi:hypothetical protein